MNDIFEKIKEISENKELIIRYRYTRDCGHGISLMKFLLC